jgi:hypothetical protein
MRKVGILLWPGPWPSYRPVSTSAENGIKSVQTNAREVAAHGVNGAPDQPIALWVQPSVLGWDDVGLHA